MKSLDSFKLKANLSIDSKNYKYFDLKKLSEQFDFKLNKIPNSIKIILENLVRNEDSTSINKEMIKNLCSKINQSKEGKKNIEIAFFPTRVLMQDFTGVPAVADLAAMRNALKSKGIDPKKINPLSRVDLIIDHSVMVDNFGNSNSYKKNVQREFERNKERYQFLKWGQESFENFYLVPPGAGICHQVNLENIAKTIWLKKINGNNYLFPRFCCRN
jgi:Aconitase A